MIFSQFPKYFIKMLFSITFFSLNVHLQYYFSFIINFLLKSNLHAIIFFLRTSAQNLFIFLLFATKCVILINLWCKFMLFEKINFMLFCNN